MPMIMRRRPLLRAAAIGGTAYYAGKRRAQAQEAMAAQQVETDQRISALEAQQAGVQPQAAPPVPPQAAPAQPAPAAPPPGGGGISDETIARLQQLGQLRDQGVLTEDEFQREKAKLLG
jgi:hypothetical protein